MMGNPLKAPLERMIQEESLAEVINILQWICSERKGSELESEKLYELILLINERDA